MTETPHTSGLAAGAAAAPVGNIERQVHFADAETMFRTLGQQDLAVRILQGIYLGLRGAAGPADHLAGRRGGGPAGRDPEPAHLAGRLRDHRNRRAGRTGDHHGAGPAGRHLCADGHHQHPLPPRAHHPAQDGQPAGVRRTDRRVHGGLRHRARRHRQDLPGHGQGGPGPAGQGDQPHHPHPAGGGGRRAAGLPARLAQREDRSVPPAALRRVA